ncbi:MAG: PilZ domain-containing protein [Pseudobutyrivibrio sp.]|nr:PilZ domain-containing protein [Pseudobutyrivibrio sp.]
MISRKAFGDETERRRHKRFPIARAVTILQGNNKFPATTVDISYGGVGMFVKKQISLVPSQPIRVDFGDGVLVPVRLVRSTFRGDGSELFGCSISQTFRPEMSKILREEGAIDIGIQRNPKEKEDAGWSQTSIKRWH